MIKTVKDIGNLVRSTRRKQKLTQTQLAAATNVGVRFIVDIEKGKETCEIGKVLQVIRMLGITLIVED